jgi:hypothetical protein
MDQQSIEIINTGKYNFKIIENTINYNNKIFSKTFKLGGDYEDCINISYIYKNGNPVEAKIPHLLYEPECAVGTYLGKGESERMIKTLLRYTSNKIPIITKFYFDDMSHIDCLEKNMTTMPPRKNKKPLKLSLLSIAYNSKTWYEKHFNATMEDNEKYLKYRKAVDFLEQETVKEPFERFIEIARPPKEQIEYLKELYTPAKTYRDFFNNIPFKDRCLILLPWLEHFMMHYLRNIYSDNNWVIDVTTMDNMKGGRNKTRKTKRYYPSKYKIIQYREYHNI